MRGMSSTQWPRLSTTQVWRLSPGRERGWGHDEQHPDGRGFGEAQAVSCVSHPQYMMQVAVVAVEKAMERLK